MTARHIFFDASQGLQLLEAGPDRMRAYCDLYESRMNELADPDGSAFHLWHHMPAPAYEETFGLLLSAGDTYIPAFGSSSDAQLLLDLGLNDQAAASVTFGSDVPLELVRDEKTVRAVIGKSVTVFNTLELWVTLAQAGEDWIIAVNGQPLFRFAATEPELPCSVRTDIGEIAIVSAQSAGPVPSHVFFDQAQGDRVIPLERERNPYRFDWGLRSIRVNAVFLMAAVLHDVLAALRSAPDHAPDPEFAQRLETLLATPEHQRIQKRFLQAYLSWPRWRPGVASSPEAGAWDRNSFTNGVIPLSVAVLARLHPQVVDQRHVQQAITAKASAFYLTAKRAKFAKISKGRVAPWWIKRSANHGMIMIFTYLAATSVAGMEDSEGATFMHELGFRALAKLYEDGSFCEGVHYNGFALAPCLPYFHLLRDAGDPGFEHFLTLMPRTYDWWSLSHDGAGQVFANFGDNISRTSSPDRVSVGRFLKNFAHADLGDAVDLSIVDAYSPFADLNQNTPTLARGLTLRVSERNQFAHATFQDTDGRRNSGLFVIGSRMQATHNRNHDGLGFAFHAGPQRIGIDRADRQPLGNNGIVFEDKKGRLTRIEGVRTYSGQVRILPAPATGSVMIQAEVPRVELDFGTKGQMNLTLQRHFLYRPEHGCPLVLRTQIAGAKGLSPLLAFNLSAEQNADLFETRCAYLQDDGTWTMVELRKRERARVFGIQEFKRRPLVFLTWFGQTEETPDALAAYFQASS